MICVENLGKRLGPRWIFRNLSFEVNPGERLAVLGKNGSGKTTLLKLLAELLPPSEGAIQYQFSEIRTGLGYCALEETLYPSLTALEHLELTASLRGIAPRGNDLLERFGIGHAAAKLASALSTGMRARLKLAIAIQAQPQLLILDEIGAGLDEEGRAALDQVFDEQCQIGAVIFATNDPTERHRATHELELN